LKLALQEESREINAPEWARTQGFIGLSLQIRGRLQHNTEDLRNSVKVYRSAIEAAYAAHSEYMAFTLVAARPKFRSFDLNDFDHQWLASHLRF
jgi:ribosomal protein L19